MDRTGVGTAVTSYAEKANLKGQCASLIVSAILTAKVALGATVRKNLGDTHGR
jgi:hypothetical protein